VVINGDFEDGGANDFYYIAPWTAALAYFRGNSQGAVGPHQ